MANSTHRADVVPVKLEEHPNADSLSIVRIGLWVVVVRTEDWIGKDKGVYVQSDSLVKNIGPFQFLFERSYPRYIILSDGGAQKAPDGEYIRISAHRFRGIQSFGLLVDAPEGFEIGDNAAEYYGIKHYEPSPDAIIGGDNEKPPACGFVPVFDVEALKNNVDVFEPGELVSISEKVHGSNSRFVWAEDKDGVERMFCGSRTNWKAQDNASGWWRALKAHPEVTEFCKANPGIVVYGEIYGQVQKGFNYGLRPGEIRIAVFGLYKEGQWFDIDIAREMGKDLPWVPLLAHNVPFDWEQIQELAEGMSAFPNADHIREGVVVLPMKERQHPKVGRVQLKVVGADYTEGKKHKKKKKNRFK